jgi:uncharacterized protein (TIGR02118 family)
MIKFFGLFSPIPGITPEEFRDYYERRHAPLIQSLFPMFSGYRRNYINWEHSERRNGPRPAFDVLTEVWLKSAEDYAAFRAKLATPEVLNVIRRDEAHFLDTERTQMLIVDEYATGRS